MDVGVGHDHAPVAVDGDATAGLKFGLVELAVSADRANMTTVGIPQHLHAIAAAFNENQGDQRHQTRRP